MEPSVPLQDEWHPLITVKWNNRCSQRHLFPAKSICNSWSFCLERSSLSCLDDWLFLAQPLTRSPFSSLSSTALSPQPSWLLSGARYASFPTVLLHPEMTLFTWPACFCGVHLPPLAERELYEDRDSCNLSMAEFPFPVPSRWQTLKNVYEMK